MTDEGTIAVQGLTKVFGAVRAVDDLTFSVAPGRVTGFLGPNGAGKTTTLRMLLGLVRPTSGRATISGRPYDRLARPMQTVGAALEAASFHPGRSALDHLRTIAPLAAVPDSRCADVLGQVGLADAADRRVGGFSLGMRQRLALATTLLGDPRVLLLDEPSNGLDPEGIAWLRGFLRHLAGQGRTVLVSSHILSEVQQTVDDVVIIARGRLVHTSSIGDLASLATSTVRVSSPDAAGLDGLVARQGWSTVPDAGPHGGDVRHAVGAQHAEGVAPGVQAPALTGRGSAGVRSVVVQEVDAAAIGAAAFGAGVELHELAPHAVGLEDVFLRLVAEPVTAPTEAPPTGPPPAGLPPAGLPTGPPPAGLPTGPPPAGLPTDPPPAGLPPTGTEAGR